VLGGIVTLAFLFIPGMRDVERTGALARASQEDDVPIAFPLVGPMVGTTGVPMVPAAFAEPVPAASSRPGVQVRDRAERLPKVHPPNTR
jgi:hypothetical protein